MISSGPLISIIIPTFNRSSLLKETLDSVVAQTYENWECIIVDDGGSDGTEKMISDFFSNESRIKYFKRPENLKPGGNAARNYGFDVSNGEYINWFDSDDLMLPNFLHAKIENLQESLDFIICSGFIWEPLTNIKKRIALKLETNLYDDYMLWKLKILTPSILFKKDYLKNTELFSDKIFRGQETELFSRLFINISEHQYKIINLPTFLYRRHEQTKSNMATEQYNKQLKNSHFILFSKNFLMCQNAKKKEMMLFFHKELVQLFFQSLYSKDIELGKEIRIFFKKLSSYNKLKSFEIQLVTYIFLQMRLRNIKIKGTAILRGRWSNFFCF